MMISIFCDGKTVDFDVADDKAAIFISSTKEYLKTDEYAASVYGHKKYTEEELSTMSVDELMRIAYGSMDYNSWHKQIRHADTFTSTDDENQQGRVLNIKVQSPEDAFMEKYKEEAVRNFIYNNLNKSQADVYYMRAIENLEFHEIAELLNDNLTNVSHRFYRAEKRLKKIFEKFSENPSKKEGPSGYPLESIEIPKEK